MGEADDSELSSNTANKVRLQIIIIDSALFLFYLLFPRYIYPRKFNIGDK